VATTQLPDGRWVVYYRSNKRVKKEYFGRGPEAEATAKARDAARPKASRVRPRPVTGPTFGELARAYAQAHQWASPRARDQHLIRMTSRLLPFFGSRPALRLTDEDLDRYVRTRRADGVKYSTIRREMVDLKAIINFAARRRPPMIPFNPIRDYRIPREDLAVIMPPTAAEFAALLAAAPEHLRRIMLLAYYLGLRPGPVECYRLRWEMVDWHGKTIMVSSAKKGGGDRRSVPLHPEFLHELRRWHAADLTAGIPWMVHWRGAPPTRISTSWAGTMAAAGIKRRLRPYDIRHLFVTQALERGADLKSLSDVVGSRPETLMRHYQHVTSALRRRTVELIPPAPIGDQPGCNVSPPEAE
jgi:integrase